MEGFVITSKGIEDTASLEIKELIDADCKIEDSCVIFDINKLSDLCLLCYRCQSADRVAYLIGSFEFNSFFEEFGKFIAEIKFDGWIIKHNKFKAECIRLGKHDFKSIDVEKKAAGLFLDKYNDKIADFDAKDYEIIFLVYIVNNKCYLGIDFAGFELNKRNYKIFLHPSSLRGTIAYSLIRESGFNKNDVLLDPFSRDGVVPIEAAFYAANLSHNYYKKDKFAFLRLKLDIDFDKFFDDADKNIKKSNAEIYCYDHLFKYVDYSKKNAKIAGVEKQINFSRTELEWLDIKFKKEGVDRIVTSLPASKTPNLDKIYKEFFYQADYILNKKGVIALISAMPDLVKNHAEKYNFAAEKEKDVWSGSQLLKIIIFKNVKNL